MSGAPEHALAADCSRSISELRRLLGDAAMGAARGLGVAGSTAAPVLTLAVAESLTCGHVQAAIGAASGASRFFLGGVTAYTGEEKVALLGVSRAEGQAVNYVSAGVAEQMAHGAAQLFWSDIALATTGYAEPAPEQGVLAPYAWWACAKRLRGCAGDAASALGEEAGGGTSAALRTAARFAVYSARVAFPKTLPRVEVQKKVTAAALAGLVTFLKHA